MSQWMKEKLGDMFKDKLEDMVNSALGIEEKDDDDKKDGNFFSKMFDRDNDEEKLKKMKKEQKDRDDDDKDNFFSKILNRDDDDDKEKKSGFSGLFSELEGAVGGVGGGEEGGEVKGQTVAVSDGDLLNDLMDVAEETSKGK